MAANFMAKFGYMGSFVWEVVIRPLTGGRAPSLPPSKTAPDSKQYRSDNGETMLPR